jgi:hypothetical protein
MDRTEQKKDAQTPVVSPLANEKTYGERVYSRIFDWGLNYWTNLIASAGFSQWAEHSTKPLKLPFIEKEFSTPRKIQENFAGWLKNNPVLKVTMLDKLYRDTSAVEGAIAAEAAVARRSMAVARSLTLLTPGHFIMIPAVWLGAKIKPWLVERWNRNHYGEDAMDDPSLQARHQAIRAEEKPTLLGTVFARLLTALVVNITSLTVGSDKNFLNKLGKKYNQPILKKVAIDPATEKIGASAGAATPEAFRNWWNNVAQKHGIDWSETQRLNAKTNGLNVNGPYTNAVQDFGRFMAADTVYTLITALLIRPVASFIRFIPGMSYKPKVAPNSPTFDGEKVKVPANRYADTVPLDEPTRPVPAALSKAAEDEKPSHKVSHIANYKTVAANDAQHLAQA